MKNTNLYDVIGVDKNATQEEIKKAFREKAKKAHTDKEGGNHEEMTELNKAYAVLKIPSKRAHYDQTGETQDTPFDKTFAKFIQEVFINSIVKQKRDVASIDLIKLLREYITDLIAEHTKAKAGMVDLIKRYEEVLQRMKSKKNNLIAVTLQQNIDFEKQNVASTDVMINFFNEAILHLKDYDYSFEAPKAKKYHTIFNEGEFVFDMDALKKAQEEMNKHFEAGQRFRKETGFGA